MDRGILYFLISIAWLVVLGITLVGCFSPKRGCGGRGQSRDMAHDHGGMGHVCREPLLTLFRRRRGSGLISC
jgi:hypothetical protein